MGNYFLFFNINCSAINYVHLRVLVGLVLIYKKWCNHISFIRFKRKFSVAVNFTLKRHVLVPVMSLKISPGVMFSVINFQFLEFAIWRRIKPFFSKAPLTKSSVNQLLLPNFLLALRHSSQKTCKITQKEKD